MNRILKSTCFALIAFIIIYTITIVFDYISILSLLFTRYLTTFIGNLQIVDTINIYINAHYSDENYIIKPRTFVMISYHILFSMSLSFIYLTTLFIIFIKSSILSIYTIINSNFFLTVLIFSICFCYYYQNQDD